MNVHAATPADIPALASLRMAYLREEFAPEGLDQIEPEVHRYFQEHLGRDLLGFLARESGEFIGAALLQIHEMPPSPNYPTGLYGTVLNVYTLPPFRGRGVGIRVLERLIEEAARQRLDCLELKASPKAKSLYRCLGFIENPSKFTPMRYK